MPNPTPSIAATSVFVLILASTVAAGQNSTPPKTDTSKSARAASPSPSVQSNKPSTAPAAKSPEPGSTEAWKMLSDSAASDKLRDRSDAISALTMLDTDRRAIDLVAHGLDDKEETIRMLAATSLGDMKARPAIPKLKSALDDKSVQVSFAAAQSLWKMSDRSGREIFYDVLVGERKVKPGPIKEKMQQARLDMHDPKALALIGVNEASGAFLGPFSMGVSMVEEYAKNGGQSVQALCAQILASDDNRATIEQLHLALADKNWTVRAAAARSLARLNDRAALPQLKEMMQNDKSHPARLAAAAAVIRLSGSRRNTPYAAPATRSASASLTSADAKPTPASFTSK
jgi:HEAT repeat protein